MRIEGELLVAINSYLCGHGTELLQLDGGIPTFKRIELLGVTYYAESYDRVKKRNSYTIQFQAPGDDDKEFGLVQLFVESEKGLLALVRLLDQRDDFPLLDHLVREGFRPLTNTYVVEKGALRAIPVQHIKGKCVYIDINGLPRNYVTCFPNTVEQS